MITPILKRFHPQGIPWPASLFYNGLSQTRIFKDHYEKVSQEISQKAGLEKGRILDMGTGPGYLLHALASNLPEARLIGIDISRAMALQAGDNLKHAHGLEGISICGSDAAAMPFGENTFDCLVSTGSFHHWKEPEKALKEAYRILKPGGSAMIYDLVRRLPPENRRSVQKEFGTLRLILLWLHSFEEPFSDPEDMTALAGQSPFTLKGVWFTGGLCCMALEK